jgi:DNA-binding transcriptional MerR regulator
VLINRQTFAQGHLTLTLRKRSAWLWHQSSAIIEVMSRYLSVSQLAELVHLSVRALHHYDAIGLLKPSHRSAGGYRLYGEPEVVKLREILLHRELGFALERVPELLAMPALEREQALLAQRQLVEGKRDHAEAVLKVIDATVQQLRSTTMSNTTTFEGFEQFQHGEYAKEAEQHWGKTEAWSESKRRTKNYQAPDWQRMQVEADAISQGFLALMQAGESVHSVPAGELAERHRAHIERWFYPCDHHMHKQVTSLYQSDARFQAHYDRFGEGLAAYISAACASRAEQARKA